MPLLYLHALNHKPSQVPTLLPRKRSTVKTLAEVRSLLPDESDHLLEKGKTKDFSSSQSFNGAELITNSSDNEVLLQSKKCLQGTCIAKIFPEDISRVQFWRVSLLTLLSNRVNLLNRWSWVEETIRYLNSLEISHKKINNAWTNLNNGINLCGRKKSKKLKHIFVLLSTLYYFKMVRAECVRENYEFLVSQH